MAEVQTAYTDTIAKAYAGMVANGETSNRITRTNEDAAAVGFGVPVFRGTGDHGCTATVGTLATMLGWTIAQQGQAILAGGAADTFPQYENVPIIARGAVYINIKGAITDGAAVTIGKGGGVADLYGATAADATHIDSGWVADETVTDALCRIVKR